MGPRGVRVSEIFRLKITKTTTTIKNIILFSMNIIKHPPKQIKKRKEEKKKLAKCRKVVSEKR